jgi:ABC-type multidrug transport system ATPase subunit
MARPPVLRLRGVRKTYGKLVAVDLLDLEVQPGQCVALIGHNGSGKTTTVGWSRACSSRLKGR